MTERVSDADRRLIAKMEARIASLEDSKLELQGLIMNHLATEYGLQPGDRIEDDGTIVRAQGAVLPLQRMKEL